VPAGAFAVHGGGLAAGCAARPHGAARRHLTIRLRALDAAGNVVAERNEVLQRTILWRPFIVDLSDGRLVPGAPRRYTLDVPPGAQAVEAQVRYHLLAESRRKRIGYQPAGPISYPIFEERRDLALRPSASPTPRPPGAATTGDRP